MQDKLNGQWHNTPYGVPIYIVDYPPYAIISDKEQKLDKEKVDEIMSRLSRIMKENKIEIICNGKRFSNIS